MTSKIPENAAYVK